MRIPRLYLSVPLATGTTLRLDDNAFNHVIRVLRLKPGASLTLFNGEGGAFAATLLEVGRREAWAQVLEALPGEVESPLRIMLAQGVARGDKMDFTIQKAVELGVAVIQPLFAERGGVDLTGARLTRKVEHWRNVVIGACEQCGRNRLPALQEPRLLADWLAQPAETGLRLLLNPQAMQGLRGLEPPMGPVTLLIGPEGGLSLAEINQAQAAGFTGVRLGPRILRTETAGVATLAALQALWGDWD
ncbi:MAG: 16S rRNA (uracil(1498)-N(3))-methyltransferase [Candidatus Competibacteraceae bacterium]|mgnify:CR=1 FL=1|nr:16S rRNA (uracil(1498)-N(3))-methyltransferase [Candidatus Competibacteraceae bacterium]